MSPRELTDHYLALADEDRWAEALPVIELDFSKFPPDKPKIASWAASGPSGASAARVRSGRSDMVRGGRAARLELSRGA